MAFNLDAALRLAVNVSGQNKIVAFGRSLEGLQGQVKNTATSLLTLNGALAALGAGAVIAKVFGDAATLQSQTRSLEVLTGSAEKAAEIVQQLRAFAGVTPFESVELIEVGKRLNAFGVEADQVVATTRRLGDVAGATGANLGELATAYGQVVAKGRLQGEELLQFQERGVALSDELRKMYGLSREEFTKALESGRISAEAVTVALQRLTDQGGKYAGGAIAQSETLNGRLSTLLDGITNLSQTIGTLLEPVLKAVLNLAIDAVGLVDSGIRALVTGFQDAYKESDIFRGALTGVIGALTTLAAIQVFSTFIAGARAAIAITRNLIKALRALTAANLLAGIANFFKSKPGLIAALVAGLGVGIDAAFNDGRVIKAIGGGISRALDSVFSTFGANVSGLLDLPKLAPAGEIPDLLEQRGAADRAAKAAEAAAKRAQTLEERRNALQLKGNELATAFEMKLKEIEQAYESIGATGVQALEADLNKALLSNNKLVDKLTLDVVKYMREVKKLGGDIAPETLQRFQQVIDKIGQAGQALALRNFNQGIKELLPSLQDYDQQIAEGQLLLENRKRGIEGLTEAQKLQVQLDLLQLDVLALTNPALAEHIRLLRERAAALDAVKDAAENSQKSFDESLRESLKAYFATISDFGGQVAESIKGAFQGLEDQLTNFVTTGKANFTDLANSILQDIARIAIRQAIIRPLLGGLGNLFGLPLTGSANGNVFAQNGIVPFAKGGIVNSPTVFSFANGIGLMGEAGPEAILPLRRGRSGRLGVETTGAGGGINVMVNVDASGTSVEGNQPNANQLGRLIGAAVQAEIVKQQRPGGLLSTTR
jgi:tape measure domain-containing protein